MSRPPTYQEICGIAHEAVAIFAERGYECCLFGSTACALYGTSRRPNDLDLIVLTDDDPEELKQILTLEGWDFFLVPSRSRLATHEVLWYSLPTRRRESERNYKVDILVPGALNIPYVPSRHIKRLDRLPVMPLLPLLLMKLQGWTDHRDSHRQDMQDKQDVDVEDIDELLAITCDTRTHIASNRMKWLPEDFVDDAQRRIYEYVEEFPNSALYWENLGFATD